MRTFTSIDYFMYELLSPRFRMMSYVLTTQKIELANRANINNKLKDLF